MASPSNYAAMLTQVGVILGGVTGIGEVHLTQRLSRDWSTFILQFTKDGVLNGWTVTRRATSEEYLTNREAERRHQFVIRGFYGVQEDEVQHSEDTFQDLVEAVCDAFRADYDLNGTCEIHGPIQVRVVDYRMFGGAFVHYAELEVTAQELLNTGA